jgi:hypothetical protein
MFTFFATEAFGNFSVVRIEQKTGNPSDGELLSLAVADAEDHVDQLAIFNGADDYELTRLVEGGSITRTLVSDGNPQWIWTSNDPDFKFIDSDSGADGTSNLAFESAGAYDITATIQTDIGGTLTTMITLDGVNSDLVLAPPDDIMLDPGGNVINFVSTTETMSLTNGSNLWTFDSAGDTFVFADAVDINAAFTASTVAADTTVSGTTITASVGFALSDADYIGVTGQEIITFNNGTIAASGGLFSSSGGIAALTPIAADADDFDDSFEGAGAENLHGGTFIVSGTGTIDLPPVTAGMNFTVLVPTAIAVDANPDSGDTISLNGVNESADENIDNNSAAGALCVFQYYAADTWLATCDANWDGE